MSVCFQRGFHLRFIVERCIIHDNETVWPQFRDKRLLHPGRNGLMRAIALKQHRREPFPATLRHNEVDSTFLVVAGDLAVNQHAAFRVSVRAVALCREAAFIKVNDVAGAVFSHPLTQAAQKAHSVFVINFSVARRFFYGCQARVAHG